MEFLDLYPWLFAPAIFLARILDVSMGTFRTIVVFRGYPATAAMLGFVEVLIWVAASSQVFSRENAWPLMLAYAGGFAAGNYVGIWLESRVAIGRELLRIIPTVGDGSVARRLADVGQSVVSLACHIDGRPSEVLLVTAGRRQSPDILAAVRAVDPRALYTITDVKSVPDEGRLPRRRWPLTASGWRVRGKRK